MSRLMEDFSFWTDDDLLNLAFDHAQVAHLENREKRDLIEELARRLQDKMDELNDMRDNDSMYDNE